MKNKDRERLIDEMTKDLDEYVSYDEWSAREYGEYNVDCDYTAHKLIEQGWIKPNKDCIILSREGYDILISVENERIKQARNEMVKKIFKKVREMLRDCDTVYEDDGYHISPDVGYLMEDVDNGLNEIEKQLGIDIKEN